MMPCNATYLYTVWLPAHYEGDKWIAPRISRHKMRVYAYDPLFGRTRIIFSAFHAEHKYRGPGHITTVQEVNLKRDTVPEVKPNITPAHGRLPYKDD